MAKNTTAVQFGERAFDFVRSASVICSHIHEGWLPSSALLLGNACELLAKRRLLHDGTATEAELRRSPYGHDIAKMWKNDTTLFDEAKTITLKLQENPSENGVDAHFDWALQFEQLAIGHSKGSFYSNRYHQGVIEFANPIAVAVVLSEVCLRELKYV